MRYDGDNATALCMGCHLHMTAHPSEHIRWQYERLGPYRFDALQERAQDLGRGRDSKRWVKAIAAHFRREHAKLLKQREAGEIGWLEFEGYL